MRWEQDQAHLQDINQTEGTRGAGPTPSPRIESIDTMEAATTAREARKSELYLIY